MNTGKQWIPRFRAKPNAPTREQVRASYAAQAPLDRDTPEIHKPARRKKQKDDAIPEMGEKK